MPEWFNTKYVDFVTKSALKNEQMFIKTIARLANMYSNTTAMTERACLRKRCVFDISAKHTLSTRLKHFPKKIFYKLNIYFS